MQTDTINAVLREILAFVDPETQITPKRIEEVVEEFLSSHGPMLKQTSLYNYQLVCRRTIPYFAGKYLHQIRPADVEDMMSARMREGVCRTTANRQRAALSKMFSWAEARGYCLTNPCRRVRPFRESTGRTRYLTPEEAERFLAECPPWLRRVVVCGLHTGGRRREILTLAWRDLSPDLTTLTFDREKTKSSKPRSVPVSPELREVLRECAAIRDARADAGLEDESAEFVFTHNGRRLRDIRTAWITARDKAGLGSDVTPHVLRHSFCSWAVMNGAPLILVQRYAGHSTSRLTERYSHLSNEYQRDGIVFIGAPTAEKRIGALVGARERKQELVRQAQAEYKRRLALPPASQPSEEAVQALADVRDAFRGSRTDRMPSRRIAILLCARPERPWIGFTRGRPLTAPRLACLLAEVAVPKRQITIEGFRGAAFTLDDLGPAFAKYL